MSTSMMMDSSRVDRQDEGAENVEPRREGQEESVSTSSGQGAASGDTQPKPRNVGPVPAFLDRTYAMVDEEDSAEIVGWGDSGDTFVIKRLDLFEEEVIPRFFNHRNLYSFVRQLNNHGFSKVRQGHSRPVTPGHNSTTGRGAGSNNRGAAATRGKQDPNVWWEFKHPNFQRGRRELMTDIKRRRERPSTGHGGGGASSVSDEVLNLMKREIDKVKGGLRIVDAKLDEVKELVLNMSRQTFAVGPVPPEYMLPAPGGWVQGPRSRGGGGVGVNGGSKGVGPPARAPPSVGSDVAASAGNGSDVGPGRRDMPGLGGGADGADDYYSVQPLIRHQHRPSQQQQQQEQHWWYPHHLHTHLWPPSRDQYYGGRDVHAQSRHSAEMVETSGPGQWPSSVQGSTHGTPPDDPPWSGQEGSLSGSKRKAPAPFQPSSDRGSGPRADGVTDGGPVYRGGGGPMGGSSGGGGGSGPGDPVSSNGRQAVHVPPTSSATIIAESFAAARAEAQYEMSAGRMGEGPYMYYNHGAGGGAGGSGNGGGSNGGSHGVSRSIDDSGATRAYGRPSRGGMSIPSSHISPAVGPPMDTCRDSDFFPSNRGWRFSSGDAGGRPMGSPSMQEGSVRGSSRDRSAEEPLRTGRGRSMEDSPAHNANSSGGVGHMGDRGRSPPRPRVKRDRVGREFPGGCWSRGEHPVGDEHRMEAEEEETKPVTR